MSSNMRMLNALALAALPEPALISYLANQKIDTYFTLDESRRLVRSTFPERGKLEKLAVAILAEQRRQSPIHNARQACALFFRQLARPYTQKFLPAAQPNQAIARKIEKIRFAHIHFGDFVKGVFADEVLALLALTQHENRTYRIDWVDCIAKPTIAAMIKVTTAKDRGTEDKATFLLFKVPGTSNIKAIESAGDSCKSAFAAEVPEGALLLRARGYRFRTDFEQQALIATGPDGDELTLHWQGKSLCDG